MNFAVAFLFAAWSTLASDTSRATEAEWQIRSWARDVEAHQSEIEASLGSTDWRDRVQALEALSRSDSELATDLVRACLEFDHPSVKASTLRLLADWRDAVPMTKEQSDGLERAQLPDVRAAFATWIGRASESLIPLERLAFDVDGVVRDEARVALFSRGTSEAANNVLNKLALNGELTELIEALELCRRASVTSGDGFQFSLMSGVLPRSRQALMSATILSNGGGTKADLEALLSGWFSPDLEGRGARKFLNSCASSLNEKFGPEFVDFCVEIDRGVSTKWSSAIEDYGRLGDDSNRLWDLFDVGADALGVEAFVNQMNARTLSDEAFWSLFMLVFRRHDGWTEEFVASCIERLDSDRGGIAVGAFERGAREGDPFSTEFFVKELEQGGPDQRDRAFRSLCLAADYEDWQAALFRHWSQQSKPQQSALLGKLPRTIAPIPFREALLELGIEGRASRAAVLDLLELFTNDYEIAEHMAEWAILDSEGASHWSDRDPAQAELLCASALRGLILTATEEQTELVDLIVAEVLDETAEFSKQIGKIAFEWLGRSPNHAALLNRYLDDSISPDNRIESALILANRGEEAATALLIELLPKAPADLVERMFVALWSHPTEARLRWFTKLALSEIVSSDRRNLAAEQLANGQLDERVLDALDRIARHAPDVDTMAIALDGLGRAQKVGAERLLAIRADIKDQADFRIAQLTDDYREWMRLKLLLALTRTGHFPREIYPAVLERPSMAASDWYDRRLAGKSTSRAEFEWRGEIELLSELSKLVLISEVLEATTTWWRLDGRLLIKLGFAVDPTADRKLGVRTATNLLRAGRIALRGEASVDFEADVRAQIALLKLAQTAKDWDRAADIVESLVDDWRADRIPTRVWNTVIGERDRDKGRDLAARYAAMEFQFRAYGALANGELERARKWSAEAKRRVGHSERAQVTQEKLEARLSKAK